MGEPEHHGRDHQGDPRSHPGLEGPESQPTEENLLDDRGADHDREHEKQDAAQAVGLVGQLAGRRRDVQVVIQQEQRQIDDRHDEHLADDTDPQPSPHVPGPGPPAQVGPAHPPHDYQPQRNAQQAHPQGGLHHGDHGQRQHLVHLVVAEGEDQPGHHHAGHHPDDDASHHVADTPGPAGFGLLDGLVVHPTNPSDGSNSRPGRPAGVDLRRLSRTMKAWRNAPTSALDGAPSVRTSPIAGPRRVPDRAAIRAGPAGEYGWLWA